MLREKAKATSRCVSQKQKMKLVTCLDSGTSPNSLVRGDRVSSPCCQGSGQTSPEAAAPRGTRGAAQVTVLQITAPSPSSGGLRDVGCCAPGAADRLGPCVWEVPSVTSVSLSPRARWS